MSKDNKLTQKQKNIFDFIKKYVAKHNYAPTIREIGKYNNLSSSATVYQYVNTLINKGYLKKTDNKFRTLEIIGENEFSNVLNDTYSIKIINDNSNYQKQLSTTKKELQISKKQLNIDENSIAIKLTSSNYFEKDDIVITKSKVKYLEKDIIALYNEDKIIIKKYSKDDKNIIGRIILKIHKY